MGTMKRVIAGEEECSYHTLAWLQTSRACNFSLDQGQNSLGMISGHLYMQDTNVLPRMVERQDLLGSQTR